MTKSSNSSSIVEIESEKSSFCNSSFFACMMELTSSSCFWEIIDLRDKTTCCIVGLLLGSSSQHANQ